MKGEERRKKENEEKTRVSEECHWKRENKQQAAKKLTPSCKLQLLSEPGPSTRHRLDVGDEDTMLLQEK